MSLFVEVIISVPKTNTFTYHTAEKKIKKGLRVVVPFGKQKVVGLVFNITENKPSYDTKPIIKVIDNNPIINNNNLKFWEFISNYYCSYLSDVMLSSLSIAIKLNFKKIYRINYFEKEKNDIIDYIKKEKDVEEKVLMSKFSKRKSEIIKMINSGQIIAEEKLVNSFSSKKHKNVIISKNLDYEKVFSNLENFRGQFEIFYELYKNKNKNRLKNELKNSVKNFSESSYKTLIKKNFIYESVVEKPYNYFGEIKLKKDIILNKNQQLAYKNIINSLDKKNIFLLHGVTSSGKTEIYFKVINYFLKKRDCQVLLMVPEIFLTVQLEKRIKEYFGEHVLVYHSKQNSNYRAEGWLNVLNGKVKLIIGARSSILLPFKKLGLVVVDEEHDTSYKQFLKTPLYNAKDLALYINKYQKNCKVLLGSATPSIESYYYSKKELIGYYYLGIKYKNVAAPKVKVLDLKEVITKNYGKKNISYELINQIEKTLETNKQAIIYQNRRGFSNYIQCFECRHVPVCKQCDVKLNYHKSSNNLVCHYCGNKYKKHNICPVCKKDKFLLFGYGTERVEDNLKEIFFKKNIIRIDSDIANTKPKYLKAISDIEANNVDIIVGTKLLTKGLDFNNLETIGVISADDILFFPNFRSNEYCFQTLTQLSGRAGRRETQGFFFIQTFQPKHKIFFYIKNNDYKGFVENELIERRAFLYPPYSWIIDIKLENKSSGNLELESNNLANELCNNFGNKRVNGPEKYHVEKVKNYYIKKVMLKIEKKGISIVKTKKVLLFCIENLKKEGLIRSSRITIDVDPV